MSAVAGPHQPECFQAVEEVADLYASQSVRVRRLVRLDVQGPDALVEDACQVAWMRLVDHRRRVRRDTAARWVVRVAVNEGRRQLRRGGRCVSLDALTDDVGDVPLPTPDLIEDLAERRERLAAIRALPLRQQRLVWLQGLGFSYAEMAGETGDTRRTVDRQLSRARHTLGEAQAA